MAVIICDIDGTLANAEHRLHLILNKPKQWDRFNELSLEDKPYDDMLFLINTLADAGHEIIFVTARMEKNRDITVQWLNSVVSFYYMLCMRKNNDTRPAEEVKKDILDELRNEGHNPFLAFDDNEEVVKMFRERGVACYKVRDYV